jgi:5-(carboxyamino)imidazole ribonucleotide mutase
MTDAFPTSPPAAPRVGLIMGSRSDWATMQHAYAVLQEFGVPVEVRVVSAHRTPDLLMEYSATAEERGLEVIIAGAGGAAHLPGMCAAKTTLPVLGVPVESSILRGVDSLLSIVQMPAGVPVGTLAIGKAGAINAALLAVAILARHDPELRRKWHLYRQRQTQQVLDHPDPRVPPPDAPESAPKLPGEPPPSSTPPTSNSGTRET